MKTKVLSIAGFDGSGGAGIQADLKTFSALGCYGMTVLTALPVQNTCGVRTCYPIPLSAIEEQLDAIFDDIEPNALKIGMLFSQDIVRLVAHFLKRRAAHLPIVLDPVMMAKKGDPLLLPNAIETLKTELIPLATVITPNLPEGMALTGLSAQYTHEMPPVAQALLALGPQAVFLKGGHLSSDNATDLYQIATEHTWFSTPRLVSKNTHGTGCTLSAAIAAYLALGMPLKEACSQAKQYLTGALRAAQHQSVGQGAGPVHHFYHLWPQEAPHALV